MGVTINPLASLVKMCACRYYGGAEVGLIMRPVVLLLLIFLPCIDGNVLGRETTTNRTLFRRQRGLDSGPRVDQEWAKIGPKFGPSVGQM